MPLPAPCNSTNAMIPGAPNTTRNAAPIGCSTAAIRAEVIGWNERDSPNSTSRAPTWAGPTKAAAAIAAVADAPAACSKPGRCAAIAPCTNQVAEKKKARIGIAARGALVGGNSAWACASGSRVAVAWDCQPVYRSRQQQVQPGPDQASATPVPLMQQQCAQRPADCARKAGNESNPRDRTARLAAVEPGQRSKGGIVEANANTDAQHRPGNDQPYDALRRSEDHQSGSDHQVRAGQKNAPAMTVDQPADRWAHCGGQEQRPPNRRRRTIQSS